jgi:ubiquinone/menaquinone biosynthesis C-methylase UbiE
MKRQPRYSAEPPDPQAFTKSFDRRYSRFAGLYDVAVKTLPVWRTWLRRALPFIEGPRVLEVSVGTGWLMTQYAGRHEAHGVDLNPAMVKTAQRNMRRAGVRAELRQGTVEELAYPEEFFDTVVNTMSFSGYPDGAKAMSELRRVLRPGGRLVMIDVGYPSDGNRMGTALVELWKRSGDLIRDMHELFARFDLRATDAEIGGWGSVHLYVAERRLTIAQD